MLKVKLHLFGKIPLALPNWLSRRFYRWSIDRYLKPIEKIAIVQKTIEQLPSIFDVPCLCPKCSWSGTVYDCEPDVDGDGNLGCPECKTVIEVKG